MKVKQGFQYTPCYTSHREGCDANSSTGGDGIIAKFQSTHPRRTHLNYAQMERPKLEDYFIHTGFYDLLPMALELAGNLGYEEYDMIEAVCKVSDKFYQYPPTKNRKAWFNKVFEEKLLEARGDILTNGVSMKGWLNK